jgi:hypothetical protein
MVSGSHYGGMPLGQHAKRFAFGINSTSLSIALGTSYNRQNLFNAILF